MAVLKVAIVLAYGRLCFLGVVAGGNETLNFFLLWGGGVQFRQIKLNRKADKNSVSAYSEERRGVFTERAGTLEIAGYFSQAAVEFSCSLSE